MSRAWGTLRDVAMCEDVAESRLDANSLVRVDGVEALTRLGGSAQ